MSVWSAIRTTLSTSPDFGFTTSLTWRRLSGVETGPIRGVGCTGVWGDCLAWRRLSSIETDPIRGVGCTGVWGDIMVKILGNVPFIGETLPKFRQKVSVFSKWARHRGDVRNFKGFVPGFGKIRGGSFHLDPKLFGGARLHLKQPPCGKNLTWAPALAVLLLYGSL
ncbi:hypothetical protein L3X38_018432 [Prunus dulcis]|uniref:Uncharacterized protein n=1 Tax=Prunus dulcis TaxID=3755 RepID=A0AAD4ZAR3_PRUDU|nr:hypothetical protein L3X38_018432 [Prunus dulcis]